MKTALVTGANTGLGYETAKALASQGYATVMACKDVQRGRAAKDRIKAEFPTSKVEVVRVDLADLDSVRDFGVRAQAAGQHLDVLCNNAGIMMCPEQLTPAGHELQFATNHLGHFLLTSLLLPLMSDPERPSRIVTVSSLAHQSARIRFEDLHYASGYSPWGAYAQSKLANILFTYELARRLPAHVTANTLHPGIVETELSRHWLDTDPPWWKKPLMVPLLPLKVFIKSPPQGAQTQIFLCTSPKVAGVSGRYYVDCKQRDSSTRSQSQTDARKLWDVSMEMTGCQSFL